MPKQLHALLVEDSELDAALLLRELARGGYHVVSRRVETGPDMQSALAEGSWEIVLSDYSMPAFSALLALEVLKASGLDIPLIIISGTIGEDIAVHALKAGASDFMTKARMTRLIPAIERELRECQLRRRQREAERERSAAEARFGAIMETATEGVVATDEAGCVAYANPAAESMFGAGEEGLIGSSLLELMPERFADASSLGLARYLTSAVPEMLGHTVEVIGRRRDGTEFPIDLSVGSWTSNGTLHFAGIMRDVTERKKVEAQLLVADRMVAVGTLSAGVAHEINNPLAAIIGNLDLAMRDLADVLDEHGEGGALLRLREELVDARDAADRVRKIVRDLRVFSRGEDEVPGPVDVEHVMESTLRMAWNEIRHRATVIKSYAGVPLVQASQARLGQVFLNLIMNAAQAMLEDRTAINEIRISTRVEGRRVLVEVADTGSGIGPEMMKRLFTPFVTSKPVGVGTGLGLSICHRIVTSFGGDISVDSEAGKGTTFRVALLLASAPSSVATQVAPVHHAPRRRGRILVVDDEPLVAKVVSRSLDTQHEVIGLDRSAEALALVLGGERFDVILCDLMMPEMSGIDFYEELCTHVPEQASVVVFMTGGAFTPRARRFLDEIPNRWLEKPFDPVALSSLVNASVR